MAEETKRRVLFVIALVAGLVAIVAVGVLAQPPPPPGQLIPLSSDIVLRGELEATLMRIGLWAFAANALIIGTGAGTLLWRDGSRSSTIVHLRAEVKQLRTDMWGRP